MQHSIVFGRILISQHIFQAYSLSFPLPVKLNKLFTLLVLKNLHSFIVRNYFERVLYMWQGRCNFSYQFDFAEPLLGLGGRFIISLKYHKGLNRHIVPMHFLYDIHTNAQWLQRESFVTALWIQQ